MSLWPCSPSDPLLQQLGGIEKHLEAIDRFLRIATVIIPGLLQD